MSKSVAPACVVMVSGSEGPPLVRKNTAPKLLIFPANCMMINGFVWNHTSGSVIDLNCSHLCAPSIFAASYIEFEIAVMLLVVRIILYGKPIQMLTRISVTLARFGFESHGIAFVIKPIAMSVRLIGPNVPFNKFCQIKSISMVGIAYGRINIAR